jgi:SAM-dependent methyltransferase
VSYVVTDTHLVVPRRERGTLTVSFDDAYVWSFSTPRDATWSPNGWRVVWPPALRPYLTGTTRVGLDRDSKRRFETTVAFRGITEPLRLADSHGHRLAVDHAGHLTRVFSETADDARQRIVAGARKALEDLRGLGYDAHLSYGCLLGAVRDGHMIGHDSDADVAYLSACATPAEVILESFGMERALRSLGWQVVRMSGADLKLMHRLPDGRVVHIDVFGAFHVGDTFYQLGGRSGSLPRSALTPASVVTLEGVQLPAPADPEAVLEFLYGASWRVPDPAFQNADPPGGLRRIQGWMRGTRLDVADWNDLYRDHHHEIPRKPSGFARWVDDQLGSGEPVADLGCGTGRDAAWLTRRGHAVLAYDQAGTAVRTTRRRMVRAGAPHDAVRALALNDRRSVLVAGAELARTPAPVNLYARGLVGCLDAEALDLLWLLASMSLRRGGSLFLEFSTGRGPKPRPAHLVGRVDLDTVVAGITGRGGVVDLARVDPGVDLFDRPDPRVARVVAHWPRPAHSGTAEPNTARKDPT